MPEKAQSLSWEESNQRYLMAALDRVRAALADYASRSGAESQSAGEISDDANNAGAIVSSGEISDAANSADAIDIQADPEGVEINSLNKEADAPLPLVSGNLPPEVVTMRKNMAEEPRIETLCAAFGLTPFERHILLLCAGMELDSQFQRVLEDLPQAHPTFSLALAALPEAHWSALSPARPLRKWRLLNLDRDNGTTHSPLRIDERVLHYLTGVQHLDERLVGYVHSPQKIQSSASEILVASHADIANRLATTWAQADPNEPLPVIQLRGSDPGSIRAIAARACQQVHLHLHHMASHALPQEPREEDALLRLWEREAIFTTGALLLECDDDLPEDPNRERTITHWIETCRAPLILASRERRTAPHRTLVILEVSSPTRSEQQATWDHAMRSGPLGVNGNLENLSAQFNLTPHAIQSAYADVAGQLRLDHKANETDETEIQRMLWDACRAQARPRLGSLAQTIEPIATWENIVLPDTQKQIIQEIAVHVRQRIRVYEDWGFADMSARGLGISALFSGVSGTGKTMAAEVLANELRLDLYRIDLSQVVSKYIGETEKNLRRVFDAAEGGGAILLFDEADALFGKRSEVKDSHDRYANIEVSYLLQRMEAYRGLAILTTNIKSSLDQAFLRRIRFVVQFPFPDAAQRAEIWRRIFPKNTPTENLNVKKLARLNVAGGDIRNIALYGAFLAAEAGEPVRMTHLLRAARVEFSKLEKTLTGNEVGDW